MLANLCWLRRAPKFLELLPWKKSLLVSSGSWNRWTPWTLASKSSSQNSQKQADHGVGVKTFCWTTSTSNFCFYTGQVPRWQCAGWWCCIVCRWRGKLVLWEGPPACTMLWPSSCDCSDQVQAVGSSFPLCMLGTCGQCTHDAGAFAKCFLFCHICRRFQKDHNFDPMEVEVKSMPLQIAFAGFLHLCSFWRLSTASLSRLLQPLKAFCSLSRLQEHVVLQRSCHGIAFNVNTFWRQCFSWCKSSKQLYLFRSSSKRAQDSILLLVSLAWSIVAPMSEKALFLICSSLANHLANPLANPLVNL